MSGVFGDASAAFMIFVLDFCAMKLGSVNTSYLLAAGILIQSAPAVGCQDEPEREPPQRFKLVVGETEHQIEPGREIQLQIGTETVPVKLLVDPLRYLNSGGLSFPYPSSFGFESEQNASASLVTLDGNSVVLSVLRFPTEGVGHREVADMTAQQYGDAVATISPVKLILGGKEYEGTRVDATILDTKLRQDFVAFSTVGSSRLLTIQDSLGEDGRESEEMTRVRKLLEREFKVDP